MRDTINDFRVREPLLVGNIGSIFWDQSYDSKLIPADSDLFFSDIPWITHFAVPDYGGMRLNLLLHAPLRSDEGFDTINIEVDWLTRKIERDFIRDWKSAKSPSELSIPQLLVQCLENIFLKWRGEHMMVTYCSMPQDGDPLIVLIEFTGCRCSPTDPDDTLRFIAMKLSEALNN